MSTRAHESRVRRRCNHPDTTLVRRATPPAPTVSPRRVASPVVVYEPVEVFAAAAVERETQASGEQPWRGAGRLPRHLERTALPFPRLAQDPRQDVDSCGSEQSKP